LFRAFMAACRPSHAHARPNAGGNAADAADHDQKCGRISARFEPVAGGFPVMNRQGSGAVIFHKEIAQMGKPKRLHAVDLRASWARRHKALADAFAADLGTAGLSAADRAVIDHAATIAVECERMKAKQLNGDAIDLDELVRLTNALTRVRKEIGQEGILPGILSCLIWVNRVGSRVLAACPFLPR
jgi:hypothetical protein